MEEKNELLSIVLASYFSSERLIVCYEKLSEIMEREHIPFELIIIDDHSKDDSFEIALELERKYKNVSAYQLSKNFTSYYAVFAGFSLAKGSCATYMPDDFQQPLETYVTMYRHWQNGNKLIIPYRVSRDDGYLSDFFSTIYYKIMNSLSVVKYPQGGCDIFFADREIIDILNNRISPINTSIVVEVLRLGFDPIFIPYVRPKGVLKSRWTFLKKIKQASDSFFSSSNILIRLISFLGVFVSFVSVLLIITVVILKLSGEKHLGGFSIPGWSSTFIFISFFSGLILFSLGIIAEYIWRIYEEVKNRPGYIIKNKNKK